MFSKVLTMNILFDSILTEVNITQEPEIVFEEDTFFENTKNRLIKLSLNEVVEIEDVRLSTYEIKNNEGKKFVNLKGNYTCFDVKELLVNETAQQIDLKMGKEGMTDTVSMEADFLKKIQEEIKIKNNMRKKQMLRTNIQEVIHIFGNDNLKIFWVRVLNNAFSNKILDTADKISLESVMNNHILESLNSENEALVDFTNEFFIEKSCLKYNTPRQPRGDVFSDEIRNLFSDLNNYSKNETTTTVGKKNLKFLNKDCIRIEFKDDELCISFSYESLNDIFVGGYEKLFTDRRDIENNTLLSIPDLLDECNNIIRTQHAELLQIVFETFETIKTTYIFFDAIKTAKTIKEVKSIYDEYSEYLNGLNNEELTNLKDQIFEKSENIRKAIVFINNQMSKFNIINDENIAFNLTIVYRNINGEKDSLVTKYYTVEDDSLKLIEEISILEEKAHPETAVQKDIPNPNSAANPNSNPNSAANPNSNPIPNPIGLWVVISLPVLLCIGKLVALVLFFHSKHPNFNERL